LEQLSVLETRKKSTVTKLTRSSKIFKTIIQAIEDKKGEQIISLDLRKIPEAVADFFIICQANNTTQVRAISDYIEHQVKEICGENHEGKQGLQWVLIDYINIVVHVMHTEARNFYKLEDMWSDAVSQGHDE
jgi:ribosome-associated protein